ncbi:hypothetical protein J5X84_10375 [Streptosporangiaceae bacterium NEAU-GS5]|nr:hypothetical protein [Streptosporangiaceae bacterium NEAU-GS5]
MAKAIEQPVPGITIGHALLARSRGAAESVDKVVHDGDTLNIAADGNFGVRMLGIDAPEVSFQLPGGTAFVKITDPRWTDFLADPFAPGLPPLLLRTALHDYLLTRLDKTTGPNHAELGVIATQAFRDLVTADIAEQGLTLETFKLRLAFGSEILDRYGRLLAYVNRDQKEAPRPAPYQERLLASGNAMPYFIWPNVDPFVRQEARLADAVPAPGTARELAGKGALGFARRSVRLAREGGLGLWRPNDPLKLHAFELRYLAQRRAPDRYVLDLSDDAHELMHPQSYFRIPNPEDRLYVNSEHAPLWAAKGWSVP